MFLGAEAAGFNHFLCVDKDHWAAETIKKNRPRQLVLHKDVEDIVVPKVDVLLAGPPCQPYSSAAKGRAGPKDKRDMLLATVKIIGEGQPKAFLIENVPGLKKYHRDHFELIIRLLRKAGYSVDFQYSIAADFGVAQTRERIFIMGFRKDLGIDAQRVHVRPKTLVWKTVGAALRTLPRPGKPDVTLHHEVNEGVIPRESRWFPKIFKAMNTYDKPAKTIMGRRAQWSNYIKYGEDTNDPAKCVYRYLTDRECMRLQGFPDDWHIEGGITACMRQIGNAVPVGMATAFCEEIGRQLNHEGKQDA